MRAARVLQAGALVAGLAATAGAQAALTNAERSPPDTGWRALLHAMPRRFSHERHEALACTGCHGSGASHRVTLVRSPRECAACHHDAARTQSCESCHRRDSIPASRTVPLRLSLATATAPRERDVTFRHEVHVAGGSGVICRDCHGTPVTLARNRECNSCHAPHHAARAGCANCHTPPPAGTHNAAVHLACAGGGCHARSKAPEPTRGRAVCLFCHQDRQTHEPEGDCALCHRIPGARAP